MCQQFLSKKIQDNLRILADQAVPIVLKSIIAYQMKLLNLSLQARKSFLAVLKLNLTLNLIILMNLLGKSSVTLLAALIYYYNSIINKYPSFFNPSF